MTAPKPNPYAQRHTNWETWLADPENLQRLTAACKANKVYPDRAAAVMRVLVSKISAITGTVDQSQSQITKATLIPVTMIKRVIRALTEAGLLIMVAAPRSAGRNGGKGRPTIYQITCLALVDIPVMGEHKTLNGSAQMLNGSASGCTPLRVITTELTTAAVSENLENRSSDETYSQSEIAADWARGQWQSDLIKDCTEQVVKSSTSSFRPDNPAAYRRTQERKVAGATARLLQRYSDIDLITPESYEYSALCDLVTCWALDQSPSVATLDLLEKELARLR
jgi:hypothetical protein